MLANLSPNWEKKYTIHNNQPLKIRLEPLHVLHGRVVAPLKDQITGATDGGGDLQSQFDKTTEMVSDGGMLLNAAADNYSR